MKQLVLNNNSLFSYLPHDYTIADFVDGTGDDDRIYTLAHNIVIIATQTASTLTGIPFEDFDEEREEAIGYVIEQIEYFNNLA